LPFLDARFPYFEKNPPIFPPDRGVAQLTFHDPSSDGPFPPPNDQWAAHSGAHRVSTYLCPSETSVPDGYRTAPCGAVSAQWGVGNYALNWVVFKSGSLRLPDSIPHGLSKTLFFAEKYGHCQRNDTWSDGGSLWAMKPPPFPVSPPNGNFAAMIGYDQSGNGYGDVDWQPDDNHDCWSFRAQAPHGGRIINVGLGDGSARPISDRTQTWWNAMQRTGSLPLDEEWGR